MGKGRKSAATTEVAAAVEEEPVTCPEGTVPVEVHGNGEKGEKGNGKAAKPLKKETQTTRYLYDGLTNVVANEYGQNGQDVAQYYRSQRDIIARKQFGLKGLVTPGQEETLPMAGGLKYYHPDLRGSVSALTDPKGQVVEQYRYDAFGGLFTGITAPYNTSGLNGHEFDPASGLVDMKARWYAPQNGRFLTPDTWRGNLQEPWTQNKYVYAGNNPVTRWDPTGRASCELGQDCVVLVDNGLEEYDFLGTRYGGGSYTPGDSWTDLAGTHQSYSGYRTTLYDYFVTVWVFEPPSVSFWLVEFAVEKPHSYTTTDPHTQESLNEYTEGYREGRTGPMPAERNVSVETMATSPGTGEKVKPVRRPVAGGSSGAQVLTQAVAHAIGERYEVQAGDSLSAIAQRVYNDSSKWPAILAANPQLQNPNVIFPGQVLNLPGAPMAPARADYSIVQQGERADATANLDFTVGAWARAIPLNDEMVSDPQWWDNSWGYVKRTYNDWWARTRGQLVYGGLMLYFSAYTADELSELGIGPQDVSPLDLVDVNQVAVKLHKHHVIPQQLRERLKGILDVDDYTVEIPGDLHLKRIHSGGKQGGDFNADWREWIDDFEETYQRLPDKDEILDFAKMMMAKYGIEGPFVRY